jgi:hypothetical protein
MKTPLIAALDTILGQEELGDSREKAAQTLRAHLESINKGPRQRRIVQIAACGYHDGNNAYNETIYALADDNTLWYMGASRDKQPWFQVSPLPDREATDG